MKIEDTISILLPRKKNNTKTNIKAIKNEKEAYFERATDSGNYGSCEIRAGDDGHLLIPFFNSLSHFPLFYQKKFSLISTITKLNQDNLKGNSIKNLI